MSRLEEMRKNKGVKAISVAKALGVTRQTYSRYERDPGKMSISQAKAVCEFLGCSVNDVFLPQEVSLIN